MRPTEAHPFAPVVRARVDALMTEFSIPDGRVYRAPDMLADPHFQAREAIIDVETERFGTLKMLGSFPKMSATPGGVHRPASSFPGQHNAEVYMKELGLTHSDVVGLTGAGVI